MVVETTDVEDFLLNIADIKQSGGVFYRNAVFSDCAVSPINEFAAEVSVVASALDTQTGYILLQQECGVDQFTQDGERAGTAAAEAILRKLGQFCDKTGLRMLPGNLKAG